MDYHYVVIGRTGIIVNETSQFAADSNNQLSFQATLWMAPEVQVLIFYFHLTGDVVYDILTIAFENQLRNTVKPLSRLYS